MHASTVVQIIHTQEKKKILKPQRLHSIYTFVCGDVFDCVSGSFKLHLKCASTLSQGRSLKCQSIESHKVWFYQPLVLHVHHKKCVFPSTPSQTHTPISRVCFSFDMQRVLFLSCCAAALMPDWEQQVWLCRSKVSVCLSLLSLAAPHSQKNRIQLWKVQFATGVALPFRRDLSLISRRGSERWKWTHLFRQGFHPFKCHPIGPCLTKVVRFSPSHLLCLLECVCVCFDS